MTRATVPAPVRGREVDIVDRTTGEVVEAQQDAVLPVRRQPATLAGLLRPVASPQEVFDAQEDTRRLIEATLKEGRDYGAMKGTDEKRKVLYKAGAERINAAFAVYADFEVLEREVDHDREIQWTKRRWNKRENRYEEITGVSRGLYRYVVKCLLIHRETGAVVATGVGACSTLETKYIDRPRDLENTVVKMAKKRAYVDATLTAYGLSDQFTQDVDEVGEVDDEAPRETRQRAARQPRGRRQEAPAPAEPRPRSSAAQQQGAPQPSANGSLPPAPASERQINVLRRLLAERDIDEATRVATESAINAGQLTRREASKLIGDFLNLPKVADAVPAPAGAPSDSPFDDEDDDLPF